jgi:DNA-binding transcriptional ArsR family regulator
MSGPGKEPTPEQLLKALGHPLRRRILRTIDQETMSPALLATDLRVPLSSVSYHVRVLADNDTLELVETRPVRGTLEHFYKLAFDVDWARAALEAGPGEDGQPPSS